MSDKKDSTDQNVRSSHQCEKESTGSFLRRVRLERGWSVASVSEATRISVKNINAIESQDFVKLPANTFVKGLVSLYGSHLGIDGTEVAERFLEERNRKEGGDKQFRFNKNGKILAPKIMAEPSHLSSATLAGVLFLIILIIFAVFCFYTSFNPFSFFAKQADNFHIVTRSVKLDNSVNESLKNVEALRNIQEGEKQTEEPKFDNLQNENAPLNTTESESESESVKTSESESTKSEAGESSEQPVPQQSIPVKEVVDKPVIPQQLAPVKEVAAQPIENNKQYLLKVHFLKQTRVSVVRDGIVSNRKIFEKGETVTWKAKKLLHVTFERPDSAELLLNGSPLMFPKSVEGKYTLLIPENINKQ